MISLKLKHCWLIFLLLIVSQPLFSQNVSRENQLKAAFLYNFSQFVTWPDDAFSNSSSPIAIGVLGENPFGPVLNDLVKDQKINGRNLIVKYFSNPDEIEGVQLLFVAKEFDKNKEVILSLRKRDILLVSDHVQFLSNGGMIRFYTEDNRLKFQINLDATQVEHFKISSKLLKMASIY